MISIPLLLLVVNLLMLFAVVANSVKYGGNYAKKATIGLFLPVFLLMETWALLILWAVLK